MSINGLVTGRIGVGKTTVCQRVVELARERGYSVGGLLTPPIFGQDGSKVGIAIVDVQRGARRTLALVGEDLGGPLLGKYSFDAEALRWGCEVLDRASREGCDLFVVDEIGRLELERGEGFVRALAILEANLLPRTLVVVRESLLDAFERRLPRIAMAKFEVTEVNRQHIAQDIADHLGLGTSIAA